MFNKSRGMNNLTGNAKAERAKYAREWRRKNPEKVRAINARYWNKKALEDQQKHKNEEEEQ